jgi:hypothetical protein
MKHIRTHYDNLKVARDAPSEVIRAAYMALSKRFHPDRNPGNADTARVMVLINTSYEVLSDPGKRHAHDQWVAEQERMATWAGEPGRRPNQPAPRPAPTQPQPAPTISAKTFAHIIRNWILYGLAAFFVWALVTDKTGAPPLGPKRYRAIPAPVRPHYVKPTAAPNGNAWPVAAGYVEGYQRLHADGLSTVTVDNSRNDSDVFVKLVSLDDAEAYPVRQFYIPAFGRFALGKLTAGRDDIRYRDLGTGGLSRSEAFGLKETSTADGTQFSNITMTLYKVQNGNMETYGLSEAEF